MNMSWYVQTKCDGYINKEIMELPEDYLEWNTIKTFDKYDEALVFAKSYYTGVLKKKILKNPQVIIYLKSEILWQTS